MENASKALLIAAGILIGLILITMIIYGHGQISGYYKIKEENKKIEQLAEFNKQFIGYNRNDVRGSDLLSLVNKIADYNILNDDEEPIELIIIIPAISKMPESQNFYYNYNNYREWDSFIKLPAQYKLDGNEYTPNIKKLLGIESEFQNKGYSQTMLVKLVANMSTLMGQNTRKSAKELLEELRINESSYGGLTNIQQDIWRYYQYVQLKRAHFDCESLTYKDRKSKTFEI